MSGFRLKLESLVLEGFEPERAGKVRAEVNAVLSIFLHSDLELIQDVLLTLVFTDRMEAHVDRVRAEQKTPDVVPYTRVKKEVMAVGITLAALVESPAQVTVVFDNDAWLADDPERVTRRVYLLGHEIGHVMQTGRRTLAERMRWDGKPRTHVVNLRMAAAEFRDEFDADVVADSVCKIMLRNDAGEPAHPADFNGMAFVEAAHALCNRVCEFAAIDVNFYRVTSLGIEDLPTKVLPLLGELMLVLGHSTGLFAGAGKVGVLRELLQRSPGFVAYFDEDWEDFLAGIAQEDRDEGERVLVEVCESVLWRLGLKLEDTEAGLYVHVHAPVLCDTVDGDDGDLAEDPTGSV